MSLVVTQQADNVLLFIFQTSSILDEVSVNQVGKELDHVLDNSEFENVVIDLGRVEMMTSSMVGRLVAFKKRCDTEQLKLKLCCLSKEVHKLFKITRLDKVFDIAKTREKATKSFS